MSTFRAEVKVEIPIFKSDNERQIVYGVVLEPLKKDAQGEWEKATTIEKAAHRFLADFNKSESEDGTELGLQHTMFGDLGLELVESYIAPQDLDFDGTLSGDEIIKKGSWVMAVHVTDTDVWQDVKDGEITGFSIGGTATVLDAE